MDATTIAAVAAAIAVIIAAVANAWISIANSKAARADAAEAKANTALALAATENTAKKVDGQTHELIAAIGGQKLAEGQIAGIAQEQQRVIDQETSSPKE